MVDQYSGFPIIILNTIFGGNASTESAGISLLLGEQAGADIYGNSVYSGSSSEGLTAGLIANTQTGTSYPVYIINNTIIAGMAANHRTAIMNRNTVSSYVYNNVFTCTLQSGVDAYGIDDSGTSGSAYFSTDIARNCFDMYALNVGYDDNDSIAYNSAEDINGLPIASANVTTSPDFDSYEMFQIQQTTDSAIAAGGI